MFWLKLETYTSFILTIIFTNTLFNSTNVLLLTIYFSALTYKLQSLRGLRANTGMTLHASNCRNICRFHKDLSLSLSLPPQPQHIDNGNSLLSILCININSICIGSTPVKKLPYKRN